MIGYKHTARIILFDIIVQLFRMAGIVKFLLLILVLTTATTHVAGAGRSLKEAAPSAMAETHRSWMKEHGRVYKDSSEEANRFEIFKKNAEYIYSFNKERNKSFKLGLNRFSDLTDEEFSALMKGYKPSNLLRSPPTSFMHANVSASPSVDWRNEGAVTPVKDQGECGKYKIKTQTLLDT